MRVLEKSLDALGAVSPGLQTRILWSRGARAGHLNFRLINELVGRGAVVVDVGASTGEFSRRLVQLAGRSGRVYAVEPNPSHQKSLSRLARHHSQFQYVTAAASDIDSTAVLLVPVHNGEIHSGLASLRPTYQGESCIRLEVPLRTLDDILASETRPVTFVKIDVEGHELAAIEGAHRILSSLPALLVEIEQRHNGLPITNVINRIVSLGYEGWALFATGLRPIDQFDINRDQLRFISDEFQNEMPSAYVNDFLFLSKGRPPPSNLLAKP